ncbi:MAG: hypothetical protein KKG47_15555 [Proteobacteria bacterium]|nr:hypothetical protein [Pseudomonadota bacterium]MBU1737953.1 hypothetical protein [Pseudomonadota bacterium]
MTKSILQPEISSKLADLYRRMEEAYDLVASELSFTCGGCPDNCCDSYFLHHTVIEWAYLWEGLSKLSGKELEKIRAKADDYLEKSRLSLTRGERPAEMCPANENGLCSIYHYRLMICRMHGVPSSFTKPDGGRMNFPGCFRCQQLVSGREEVPEVERTIMYRELAFLEKDLLLAIRFRGPRIKMTIAEMIVHGPPQFQTGGM